jgi:uncharacterized membrane protein
VSERRVATKRAPVAPAGLGPRPRLAKPDIADQIADPEPDLELQDDEFDDEQQQRSWRSTASLVICALGVGVSIYVTILHYGHIQAACSDSGAVNCQLVLTSPQSVFLGIPVPLYGLAFFIAMFAISLPIFWRTTHWWIPWARIAASAIGILFALRLIYEELFVIRKLCLWCTSAHVLSFFLFVIIVTGWEDANRNVIPRRST